MRSLEQQIDTTAQDTGFSGVVRVDWHGSTEVALAYGHADRAFEVANTARHPASAPPAPPRR